MKTRVHKLLCILLALCVMLSVMPLSVFADDAPAPSTGTTTNGAYTNGSWSQGGTGSVTYNVDGTDVTLSKTAAPVPGMDNTFDITLSVRTSTTSISKTNAGAVVLVMDVSGSMNFCSVCGGDKQHADTCSYYQEPEHRGDRVDNSVKSSQSRLTAAKGAANAFLASYAGTDAAADRQLAIVTFSSGYGVSMRWRNVAGGKDKNSYNTASSTINGLTASGGTNLEGGLYEANDLLKLVQSYGTRSVVLLTDGAPTYRLYGGTGTSGSKDNNDAAQKRATTIKNSGASLYTICFGAADEVTYTNGPTVGNFLSASIASSGCAYNASNPSALYSAFAAISESITSGLSGSGWTATDPMADMIAVSSAPANITTADGHTYTWTLDNAQSVTEGNTTTYVYTTTYRVTLDVQDENFVEGQFFPTNEETYLHIDDQRYAFPVPGVKGVLPRTDVTVTKQWSDSDNQDGIRPASITVQLMEGNTAIGDPVVLSASNNWSHTWTDLIEMSKGVYHNYSVVETNVPQGYTASYSTDENNRFALVVTNSHDVAKKDLTVNKIWNDNNNQDGIRPASITVNLLADGVPVDSAVLNAENGWMHIFSNLDVNKNGSPIRYTVAETGVPEGYTASVNGLTVTNTHEVAKVSVPVSKVWADNDNQDGIRPNDVTVKLMANGEDTGKTLVLSAANDWAGSFTDLDAFANGNPIVYSVAEMQVAGYASVISGNAESGFVVTNSHTPETTSVSGSKTWVDNNNQDGKRPDSITIHLLKNGNSVDTKVVTASDGWAWTFENLPKYENGTLIRYTVSEDAVTDYSTTYNGTNITNTHTPDQLSITVSKVWADNNNQDGIRPNDITVSLLANGEDTGKTLVLSNGNGWTGSFTDLDKYSGGQQIAYTVKEVSVAGYTSVITGDMATGFTVTNAHTPETTSVSGSKTWADNNNQDGKRPDSITIHLLKNGEIVDTKVVTANDGWAWTFENLPKYENGTLIRYTVSEDAVTDYSTTYNGYNVTNTHTPDQLSVTVSKVWSDSNNQDGIRPNDITVSLLANGKDTGKTLVLSSGNNWTGSFTELDKYSGGQQIDYTVKEVSVEGYSSVITGDMTTGFTVTNSHTPETTSVSGSKTWADNNNQDGKRPDSITIHLLKNGEIVDTKVVTANDGWAWSFENLAKKDNGRDITYSISEDAVTDYSTTYNGYNVTNTHTPAKLSVTVTKSWQDSDNQDGIRPNDITVKLLADGKDTGKTLVLSSGNNWTGSFTELDKFSNGQAISYTIEEVSVEGYTSIITGDMATGFTVTNAHTPETLEIRGSKTWKDKKDQDGKRPDSIVIHLNADGNVVATKTVTAEDDWSWSFTNLPKYKDGGKEIVYSITEDVVSDYSTSYDGYDVINEYTPQQTSITVTKVWEDGNDQDGIRPEKITVILLADGQDTGKTLVLSSGNNWTDSFTELDVYANGEEIVYTIQELEIEGYTTVITGTVKEGFTITNSHTPEVLEIHGKKTWMDNNNQDGVRPDSITVHLNADGVTVASKTVTAEDDWSWSFTNQPKFKDGGEEIVYTITEDAVDGYSATYDGYNVTNSYTPTKINISVKKVWVDSNDGEGIRPDSVTIHLYADGKDTGLTLKLSKENNWSASFENLPKNAGGKEIVYEIKEDAVKNYNAVITGSAADGFTVTNSHNYIPKTGDERTPILWISMMAASFLVIAFVGGSLFIGKKKGQKK